MNDELKVFCENVKILRKRYGLTQKEMAEICNVGVRSIAMLEKGILPERLSASILFRLSYYFKIAMKDLFKPISIE